MPDNNDLTAEERECQSLIQELQKLYATRLQDEQDLEAIRHQLVQSNVHPMMSGTQGKAFQQATDKMKLGTGVQASGLPKRHRTSWSRPLGVLAATLLVALLAGSFVLLQTVARNQQVATSKTGATIVATPCNQAYPIAGTISKVNTDRFEPHAGDVRVEGSREQYHGLLGGTFMVDIRPDTQLFEQQKNGCHAISFASLRAGQRVQLSAPTEILQSYPAMLMGVDRLVVLSTGH